VVESTALEMRRAREGTQGSNPCLSAKFSSLSLLLQTAIRCFFRALIRLLNIGQIVSAKDKRCWRKILSVHGHFLAQSVCLEFNEYGNLYAVGNIAVTIR
jgi:hypothetical protein